MISALLVFSLVSLFTWFATWHTMRGEINSLKELNKSLRERIKFCEKYHTKQSVVPEKEIESPPDFEAMALEVMANCMNNKNDIYSIALSKELERIWKEHYLPLKEENKMLKFYAKLNSDNITKMLEDNSRFESELNSLKEENERLKESPQ